MPQKCSRSCRFQRSGSPKKKISASLKIEQALKADLIVDAILGTGFKPPLKDYWAKAVEIINQLEAPVLAVDIPSGA